MGRGTFALFATMLPCIGTAASTERAISPSAYDWRIGGTVQGDGLLTSDAPKDAEKRTELRRARIGARVVLARPLRFSVSGDFSNGARLGDLYLDWRPGKTWFMAGRFPEPFGLEAQESSRTSPLMERPQASALGPGYNVGLGFNRAGRSWGLSGGAFKGIGPSSDEDILKGARKEDALTLRLIGVPLRRVGSLLHLGLGASLRRPDEEAVRFVAIPESVLIEGYQVGSGLLPVDDFYTLLGAEFALQQGPVLLQSEFLRAAIRLDASLPQSTYTGYYVEAAWALSGERRPYSTRYGVFGPITPTSRWNEGARGAWELSARYGAVRFDKNPLEDIPGFEDFDDSGLFTGGKGRIVAIGLNWYPSPWLRVSLNALDVHKRREGENSDARLVQMRAHFQFDLKRNGSE